MINFFNRSKSRPKFSFLILCYDMAEEVKNTLLSLTPEYQTEEKDNYEVLIAENPSPNNLSNIDFSEYGADISYFRNKENIPLTKALNDLATKAKGEYLIVIPDGARLLSSGIIKYCKQAIKIEEKSIVAFHGFHLGLYPQQISLKENLYSKEQERSFLRDINFPKNPDALFFNACWAGSSKTGSFFQMAESNCLMLPKLLWDRLGGYDQRLDSPSGGLANLDLYSRAVSDKNHKLFFVLGEGSFHQLHGGDTTNSDVDKFSIYKSEYLKKTGSEWKFPNRHNYEYLGRVTPPYLRLLKDSVFSTIAVHQRRRPPHIQSNISEALSKNVSLPNKREFIFILSMHRSKSSYFAGKIKEAMDAIIPGTELGGSSRSNEKGHYEPWEIVVNHNNILNELGLSWRSLSEISFPDDKYIQWRVDQLSKILGWGVDRHSGDTSNVGSFLIKDPRLCRLWTIWENFLDSGEHKSKKIVLIDHPDKIANSLYKRDKLNFEWAKLLWARYTLDSIKTMDPGDILVDVYKNSREEIQNRISTYIGQNVDMGDYNESERISGEGGISEAYENYVKNDDLNQLVGSLERILRFVNDNKGLFRDMDRYVNEIS